MAGHVNGLTDMHTILAYERKVGGAIEAKRIRMRTGEVFESPVITCVDYAGSTFYSLGFVSADGERMIVNVTDISMIQDPVHRPIRELQNEMFKAMKIEEKRRYLKRLCEINEGACTPTFVEEVRQLVEDIGYDTASETVALDFLRDNERVIRIAS